MTPSRELKCFSKLLTVCNNRGFGKMATDILTELAPRYLNDAELRSLKIKLPNEVKFADKLTFLEKVKFGQECQQCKTMVEVNTPAFLRGKKIYHTLCALDIMPDEVKDHPFYQKWAGQGNSKNDHPKKK